MQQTIHNPRIAHIQKYANDNGYALALPIKNKGLHTIGYPLAGNQQSMILDKAVTTLISIIEG